MDTIIKILYSLLIGLIAGGIAKLVHPKWGIIYLFIFGFVVFAITFILALIIKR